MLKKIEHYLFTIFLAVFMIALFNRELLFFGFDIRILPLFFGITLLCVNFIHYIKDKTSRVMLSGRVNIALVLFFIVAILSNIAWAYNGLEINQRAFIVVFASVVFNFLMYIVFLCNVSRISWKKSYISTVLAGCILILSMIAAYFDINLKNFSSEYPGAYIDKLAPSFIDEMRYGGYAQDPNYASIFLIILAAFVAYEVYRSGKKIHLAIMPFIIFCILLSASKTILIAVPFALLALFIKDRRVLSFIVKFVIASTVILTIFFAISHQKTGTQTIDTRVNLWHASITEFYDSPLVGSGLTSSRSAAAETKWYVQPHSSIVQVVIDTGIIGLILLLVVVNGGVMSGNKLVRFLTIIFFAHMLTHETIYQLYFIFFLGVLPLLMQNNNVSITNKTAAVYVVNTLSNGGAERVVQVMANNSLFSDKVVIYTLYDSDTTPYDISEKVEIIPLKGKNTKFAAPLTAMKLTRQLDKLSSTHTIHLATSHLPLAHIVTRLSRYHGSFMYVMHGMYGVSRSPINTLLVKILYYNHQLISVSKGLARGDIVGIFGVRTDTLKTIYNPQDFSVIDKKVKEESEGVDDAILFIGRFAPPKNPLGAIRAYEKSNISKYKLLMLGDGPMRQDVENYIDKHHLGDRVKLLGFVDNPYKYLANARMLVISSEYEAFTMVACEAMYCNCPVVSYDIKYGMDEILTGNLSQYIAKNADVDDLGRIMRLAIKQYPKDLKDRIALMVEPEKIMTEYYNTYKEWNK